MKRIYLSGKMTGLPNLGFDLFDKNRDFLKENGWDVISPADIDRAAGLDFSVPFTEEQYHKTIKRDYAALLECDAIAFMNNWTESRGAKLESDFANVLKLDRYRVDVDNSYFEQEIIIGLTGFARSGKDTIAKEFVQNNNFERHGFADALKKILYELDPKIDNNYRLKAFIDQIGWDEAKKEPEIRQLLQRLGTEAGRAALGQDIWVDTLFSMPHKARLIIPDLRFENEANEVRRRGGVIIRIVRDGVGPVNDHPSDQIDFATDYTIQNNGTPRQAYEQIINYLENNGIFI